MFGFMTQGDSCGHWVDLRFSGLPADVGTNLDEWQALIHLTYQIITTTTPIGQSGV
jgi:hypothetical protein